MPNVHVQCSRYPAASIILWRMDCYQHDGPTAEHRVNRCNRRRASGKALVQNAFRSADEYVRAFRPRRRDVVESIRKADSCPVVIAIEAIVATHVAASAMRGHRNRCHSSVKWNAGAAAGQTTNDPACRMCVGHIDCPLGGRPLYTGRCCAKSSHYLLTNRVPPLFLSQILAPSDDE